MIERRTSDLVVACLEAEGVTHVFGIPGEETLDLNVSLEASSISFVPVRHEQGGAYMADTVGRLTGRAGVCLGTLGPGAMNLVTPVGDALLDRAPLVALTGQADLERLHKESHQHVDLVELFRPITKWNARVMSPEIVPEVVRKAFKVAEAEKPGPTHLELPEDVLAAPCPPAAPLPRSRAPDPQPGAAELQAAAALLREARCPVALAGNGVVRARAAPALRAFSRATGIPVAETFMGKGVLPAGDPLALGTVGLQARDYELAGFDEADVVVAIGYDLVEHAPKHWNPRRDKAIIVVDTQPAEIDGFYPPAVELVGDLDTVLCDLAASCGDRPPPPVSRRLHDLVHGRFEAARTDEAFPLQPPRALWEIRRAMGPEDVLVSDVGLHKLWIGRMFPASEPGAVLIANGLAGMGLAVPCAIAAKLVRPERRVVAVSGDGGFLRNVQELETARRLRTPFVSVVWENGRFGSIAAKQDQRFGAHFGVEFTNPDFVALARAFGLPGWRCAAAGDLEHHLRHALTLDAPSVVVVPVDDTPDVALGDALGHETFVRT